MDIYTKHKRQAALRELVGRSEAGDQGLILQEMAKRGFPTTQATISRDLHEMGFVKVRVAPGAYRYELFDQAGRGGVWERLTVLFENFVLDIRGTGQMLLIKTSPGNANGVASLIDALQKKEILGTIAGDDTVLVVTTDARKRKAIEREFKELL
jgi:transcriptional regulator of arginine metabolism